MSYFSNMQKLAFEGIDFSESGIPDDQPRGCIEPTEAYGATPGIGTFEEGVANGDLVSIPEVEWPERIEQLEAANATLQHRLDADWGRPLSQGRCGYCWSYAVIMAMMANDARDGGKHRHYAAAYPAAQIMGGRDRGGWPVQAANWIQQNGVPLEENWRDCRCSGKTCKGPRGGCQARDLSRTSAVSEPAKLHKIGKQYEVPRGAAGKAAVISALLDLKPAALGWVGTGAWCDGHAMGISRVIRTSRGGYEMIPDNSWGKFKRRVPVRQAATGGVIVVNNEIDPSVR